MIALKIDSRGFMRDLKGVVTNIERAVVKAGDRTARTAVNYLVLNAKAKGLMWRGTMIGGIKYDKPSRYVWDVKVPLRGIYIDRMRPHWVKLKRGRLIRDWAWQQGHYFVKAAATAQRSIFVRPHPWIEYPLRMTMNQTDLIFREELRRSMKK